MPQKAWTDKRERQYEHIKDSYEDRGVSEDEAEERAARTVNKQRSEHGGDQGAAVGSLTSAFPSQTWTTPAPTAGPGSLRRRASIRRLRGPCATPRAVVRRVVAHRR